MTDLKLLGRGKLLYISPLAEQFFVSFEECILSNTTSSTLKDRIVGEDGTAGTPDDPDDFDGGSIDL